MTEKSSVIQCNAETVKDNDFYSILYYTILYCRLQNFGGKVRFITVKFLFLFNAMSTS